MSYKILGQNRPSATVNTVLYTVPTSKEVVISTLNFANVGSAVDYARVYVVPAAGSASQSNALYYDLPVNIRDCFQTTCGLTLAAGDKVIVYSLNGNITFQAFGNETTA